MYSLFQLIGKTYSILLVTVPDCTYHLARVKRFAAIYLGVARLFLPLTRCSMPAGR